MKTFTATVLGLCVVLAVVCSTQAHCGGMKACKKYMNEHTEEDKAMYKECMGGGASGTSEGEGEEKKAIMLKMAKCVMMKTEIIKDGKFVKAKFEGDLDKRFKDAEKAAAVKKEAETCVTDGQDCSTDEQIAVVAKCMWMAMKKGCGEEAAA